MASLSRRGSGARLRDLLRAWRAQVRCLDPWRAATGLREERRVGNHMIVGVARSPAASSSRPGSGNIRTDDFEASGHAIRLRVLASERRQGGIDLDAGDFRSGTRARRQREAAPAPQPASSTWSPACAAQEAARKTASNPERNPSRGWRTDAAIQKSIARKVEMTGHAKAEILRGARADVRAVAVKCSPRPASVRMDMLSSQSSAATRTRRGKAPIEPSTELT